MSRLNIMLMSMNIMQSSVVRAAVGWGRTLRRRPRWRCPSSSMSSTSSTSSTSSVSSSPSSPPSATTLAFIHAPDPAAIPNIQRYLCLFSDPEYADLRAHAGLDDPSWEDALHTFQRSNQLAFKDPNLLKAAMTHSSGLTRSLLKLGTESPHLADEKPYFGGNHALEFLGDAVLGFIVKMDIFQTPDLHDGREGSMTGVSNFVLSNDELSRWFIETAAEGGLGGMPSLRWNGTPRQHKKKVAADATEALFGAVFLDRGIAGATELYQRLRKHRQQRLFFPGRMWSSKSDARIEISRWSSETPGDNSAVFRPRWSQLESATHLRDALSRRPVAAYLTTATDHDANGAERIVEHKYQCVLEVCNTFLTPAESRKVDNVPALLIVGWGSSDTSLMEAEGEATARMLQHADEVRSDVLRVWERQQRRSPFSKIEFILPY